jgi:hypothetical protein
MDTTAALNPEDMSVDDFIAEAEAELAALEPRYRAMTAGQRRDEEARLEQAASGGEPEAQTALSGWRAVGQMVTALEPIHQARLRYAAEQAAEDALRSCSYLGGLRLVPAPIKRCSFMLLLQSNQILLDCRPRPSYELPWDAVRDVEVRHTDRVAEPVTATRVATLGIFAWAAKKQRKQFLHIRVTRQAVHTVSRSCMNTNGWPHDSHARWRASGLCGRGTQAEAGPATAHATARASSAVT